MKRIKHVVHLSTASLSQCEHCTEANPFAESINHYIEAHGYRLLHVGQESSNSGPDQYTVAVLGHDKPPEHYTPEVPAPPLQEGKRKQKKQ